MHQKWHEEKRENWGLTINLGTWMGNRHIYWLWCASQGEIQWWSCRRRSRQRSHKCLRTSKSSLPRRQVVHCCPPLNANLFYHIVFCSSPGRRDSLESHRSLWRWCPLCPVEGIVKVGRIITILIGSTPSAAGVAVKEILVGAGETKSPTRLNAVATDSLRDWICCHYLFKEYQATHSWMCISIYVQTISNSAEYKYSKNGRLVPIEKLSSKETHSLTYLPHSTGW